MSKNSDGEDEGKGDELNDTLQTDSDIENFMTQPDGEDNEEADDKEGEAPKGMD